MTNPPSSDAPARLTHLDEGGAARMVDVGEKVATRRVARAEASVRMSPATATAVLSGDAPKGDVIGTARLAGIQAAKRTDELIPLAHTVPLAHIEVAIEVDAGAGLARISSSASTIAGTGVEMEALTACALAALTLYDMVKGVERGVTIERIELVEKTGGKSDWHRDR